MILLKFKDTERALVALAFIILVVATGIDLHEDWGERQSVFELFSDAAASCFVAAILFYIWIKRPQATQDRNKHLESAVQHSNEDLAIWKEKASKLLHGLGEAINQQFDRWQLSNAEKEVGLLLIKGMSHKEIATIRGTHEKTIRQQSSSIYAKANLDNRAELSAFFLEDFTIALMTVFIIQITHYIKNE